jgi:hypothetical protein
MIRLPVRAADRAVFLVPLKQRASLCRAERSQKYRDKQERKADHIAESYGRAAFRIAKPSAATPPRRVACGEFDASVRCSPLPSRACRAG